MIYIIMICGGAVNTPGVLARIFKGSSTAKLLDFFMDHGSFDYSVAEISKSTSLSTQTVSKGVLHLAELGLIDKRRVVGKTPLYCLSNTLPATALLGEFALQVSRVPALSSDCAPGAQQVIEIEAEGNTPEDRQMVSLNGK